MVGLSTGDLMFSNHDIPNDKKITQYTVFFLGQTLFINAESHAIYHIKISQPNHKFIIRNYADWRVHEI